ncbi:hypothetical protein [Promicromonospora sp. NPDC023987]|uniref:hypothetical protein n=1 Tax=Promicromonospora sp. NPDC023987 TaxID=3155360 RepID=UPI0033C80FD3
MLPAPEPDTRGDQAEVADDTTHTVRPGETLTGIAQEHYGDPAKYRAVAQASKDTEQPGGGRLLDPDHIKPGWILTLPHPAQQPGADFAAHQEAAESSHATEPQPSSEPPNDLAPASGSGDEPTDRVEGDATMPGSTGVRPDSPWTTLSPQDKVQSFIEPNGDGAGQADVPSQETNQDAPAWLLPGVAAGGALLAAGLHMTLTRARSRQARLRRPGRMVAQTPRDLVPVIATARFVGGDRTADVQRLDRLLRALAGPHLTSGDPRPQLAAVELADDQAVLHLAAPATLPEPWSGDATRWTAPLAAAPDECRDLVPYPVLVTIGTDQAGHVWLLDLENLRTVAVTGQSEDVVAFGRHVVAELAVNPWTVNLTTHTVGVGKGAAGLSQYRVEEHEDTGFLGPITTYVRHSADEAPEGEDHEWFHAVVTTTANEELSALSAAIHAHPGRPSTVIVTLGVAPRPDDIVLAIQDGRLRVEVPEAGLALDLVPVAMSAEELADCGRLVELTRDTADVANPLADAIAGRAPLADDLKPAIQVTHRPDDPETPGGPGSILPGADAEYLTKTANTAEDLARLAPIVQPAVAEPAAQPANGDRDEPARDQATTDATLDQDLADWWNQDTPRPRIEVLGPVSMWGAGPTITNPKPSVDQAVKAVAERRPMFVLLAAFIAMHPQGVTLEQIELVNGGYANDARFRITTLRAYFGDRPNGGPFIPLGKPGRPKADAPPRRHRIEGALVDAHLFRRLYQRAIQRGADGLPDLVAALELVSGRPFTLPKDDPRWLWATGDEGLADQYTALIGDVAHLVITRAILDKDLPLARRACQTWRACDPASEALAADDRLVTLAEGHPDQAQQIAAELWTRNDDETGPTGPGERTLQILDAHDHGTLHATARQTETDAD